MKVFRAVALLSALIGTSVFADGLSSAELSRTLRNDPLEAIQLTSPIVFRAGRLPLRRNSDSQFTCDLVLLGPGEQEARDADRFLEPGRYVATTGYVESGRYVMAYYNQSRGKSFSVSCFSSDGTEPTVRSLVDLFGPTVSPVARKAQTSADEIRASEELAVERPDAEAGVGRIGRNTGRITGRVTHGMLGL